MFRLENSASAPQRPAQRRTPPEVTAQQRGRWTQYVNHTAERTPFILLSTHTHTPPSDSFKFNHLFIDAVNIFFFYSKKAAGCLSHFAAVSHVVFQAD